MKSLLLALYFILWWIWPQYLKKTNHMYQFWKLSAHQHAAGQTCSDAVYSIDDRSTMRAQPCTLCLFKLLPHLQLCSNSPPTLLLCNWNEWFINTLWYQSGGMTLAVWRRRSWWQHHTVHQGGGTGHYFQPLYADLRPAAQLIMWKRHALHHS